MPHLASADGARLFYDVEGEGPSVVLVHGGTGTGEYDWEFQRVPLARDHRVVIPDLRGHGRSSDPRGLLGIDQIGADLTQLVAELDERPAAIVGFSIGATALLRLLCADPGLAASAVLVGASPVGHPERVPAIVDGPWPRELRELRHEHGTGDDHWRALRRQLAQSWAGDLDLSAEDIAAIDIPTLVVGGDRDSIEPVETALGLARALPRGELLVVPGCGHFVPRARPVEFTAALRGFLERHAGT